MKMLCEVLHAQKGGISTLKDKNDPKFEIYGSKLP